MNKKYIVIILVVLVCLGFVIYGLVYNHSNSNNKNDEKRKKDISYEDFKKEYGEYNWEESIKITNNNAEKCESVHGIILFYDEYGNVISNSYIYAYGEIEANESRIEKLYNYPHSFDSYDVIISRIR